MSSDSNILSSNELSNTNTANKINDASSEKPTDTMVTSVFQETQTQSEKNKKDSKYKMRRPIHLSPPMKGQTGLSPPPLPLTLPYRDHSR